MSNATVIEVELLAGRYHAHIWGESQFGMAGPEWPPSPWRLLRALASAWFSIGSTPSSEADRDALFEALGRSDPPELWLPKASFHELRYYQPIRLGGSDRVLHHDFYAVPEGGRFYFRFHVSLTKEQRALLAALLGRLRYLGRSESRARLRVVDYTEPPAGTKRVRPPQPGQLVTNRVYRRVLCAAADFRASDLWGVPDGGTKMTPTAGYPPHLVDTLLDHKMPLPSGARWVEYAVPDGLLVHEIRPRSKPLGPNRQVNVAEIRFRLCRRIPIPLRLLIPVARAFRDAAVRRHRDLTGAHSVTLTGRESDGRIARGHRHAYYLPHLSETGTVDALIVRIPAGSLTRQELDALLGVERIRVDESQYPITVIPEETIAESTQPEQATRWVSMTPFLPPIRWRSGRHRLNVEEAVAFCTERLGVGRPVSVCTTDDPGGVGSVSSLLVHEYFNNEDSVPSRRPWRFRKRLGFWLELTFDDPTVLNMPLGADSHFGAGQFRAC